MDADSYPILPGIEHWNPYHDHADIVNGVWGREFEPGVHYDIRQPSTLTGLCVPRNHGVIHDDKAETPNEATQAAPPRANRKARTRK